MKKTMMLALLAALLGCGNVASAQSPAMSGPVSGKSAKDGKFLSDLMAVNNYELMLIKLSLEKGTHPDLKAAANRMLPDHQKLEAELNTYANRLNFGMDPDKREKYASKLGKWSAKPAGAEWDADMIEEFVDIHKDGVDMLDDAKKDVADPELKSMLEQTSVRMREHLNMLTPLKGKIKHADGAGQSAVGDVQSESMNANAAIVDRMQGGSTKDAKFFSDLMGTNLYILNLLEIVLKKAQSQDLKDVSRRMMEDHQGLAARIKRYGTEKSYGMEPDKGSKYNDKIAKWTEKKGGMEWDADIIEELRDLHKDDVDMLEDAIKDAKDEEFKALLSSALTIEKDHLDMVAPLKEKIKKPWKNKQ